MSLPYPCAPDPGRRLVTDVVGPSPATAELLLIRVEMSAAIIGDVAPVQACFRVDSAWLCMYTGELDTPLTVG